MFMGMAILLPVIWFLPWWSVALISLWMGWISGPRRKNALNYGLAAGFVWSALAFIKDGRSGALISQKMAGLLSLPFAPLLFLLVFVIAFVTAFLCFQAGATLSTLYTGKTISTKSGVSK